MRPVGALLLFSDGSVLLLSEREADALTAQARRNATSMSGVGSKGPVLLNLCYAQEAWQRGGHVRLARPLRGTVTGASGGGGAVASSSSAMHITTNGTSGSASTTPGPSASSSSTPSAAWSGTSPPACAMAAIQLFDGQTSYGGEKCGVYLARTRLVGGACEHKAACLALVGMRGKQSLFSHSDLERACDVQRPEKPGEQRLL